MQYFVLALDHASGKLDVSTFEAATEALAYLRNAERSKQPQVEVVYFMSTDLETLRSTHSRFFQDSGHLADDLRELIAVG